MALKKFNSQSGFSVGLEPTITVVDSNGNIIANTLEVTNFANLGSISNISILGGNPDQVVATDGFGTLFFKDAALTLPAGSNRSIQYNNSGLFGGDSVFTYNSSTGELNAGSFTGNGIGITHVVGANVFGEVSNANYATYALFTLNSTQSNTTTTVIGNYQPNINQVGDLENLTVTGALIANSSLIVGGDATITGNLIVEGNAIYADVETLRIENPIMQLGANPTGGVLTEADDYNARGTLMHYFNTNAIDAFMGWNDVAQEFVVASNVSLIANLLIIHEYGNLQANYFIGDGSRLSNITGANVTGKVANAIYTDYANLSGVANTVNDIDQPNIRSFGTLTSLAVSPTVNPSLGNAVTANFFVGNGYRLFGIVGGNVTGAVPNATHAVNANVSILAGHVTAADQSNITSVGALTSLTVDGSITAQSASLGDSVTAVHIIGEGGNLSNITGANVSGIVANANYSSYAGVAEYVTQNAQSNITSVGILTRLTVSGVLTSANANLGDQIRGNYFIGDGSNLTSITGSNVTGIVANADFSANAGVANYANFAGNVVIGDQPNITGVGLLTLLNVGGNLTAGNANLGNVAIANFFSGNGTYLANIQGANVVGNVDFAIQANHANFANFSNSASRAGTVTTNNQPNITGVGTLGNLIVSGNISVSNISAGNTITGSFLVGDGYQISNISGANVESDVANANYANFAGSSLTANSANIANLVYNNIQPNINQVGTLTFLDVSGALTVDTITANNATVVELLTVGSIGGDGSALYNIFGPNVIGKVPNAIFSDNANLSNTANYAINVTGNNQPNINSLGSLDSLVVIGSASIDQNLTVGELITANHFAGDGSNISNITGANVTGKVANAIYSDDATHAIDSDNALLADVANTVSDSAQPNITSVGPLLNLSVLGNETIGGNLDVVGNITVSKITAANLLGTLSGNVLVTGSNGAIMFNDAGNLKPANVILFDKTSNTLSMPGNFSIGNNLTRDGKTVTTFVSQATRPTNPKLGDQWFDTDTSKIYQFYDNPLNASYAWVDISTGFINSNITAQANTLVLRDAGGNIFSNNLSVIGDASIAGNLDVKGAVTYIQSTVTYVTDPITEIGGGANGDPLISNNNMDRGTLIHNYTTQPIDAFIGWDTSNAEFALANNVTVTDNIVTFIDYGNLRIGNLSVTGSITSSTGGALVVGNAIPLGYPTDGNLESPGALDNWSNTTTVTDAIDDLNEVMLNVVKGTFVGNVDFTASTLAGPSPLSLSFTRTFNGTATNYLWDFGDGTTSTSSTPTKTYTNLSGGQFTVTLTISNSGGTGAGSSDSKVKTDYITLYTPTPIASFTLNNTALDTGNSISLTNTSQYAQSYVIHWGDGTSDTIESNSVAGGAGGGAKTHTYTVTGSADTRYQPYIVATSTTSGASPVSVTSATQNVYVYKTHSPAFTYSSTTSYASQLEGNDQYNTAGGHGFNITFTNTTPAGVGATSTFSGNYYKWTWGDGTTTSVNAGSGSAGDRSVAITHKFSLTNVLVGQTFIVKLEVYNGYSTSPFSSSTVTVIVNPDPQAIFSASAVTLSDKTGDSAQTGYYFTDLNGTNRAIMRFTNSSNNATSYKWTWGDGSDSGTITTGPGTPGSTIDKTYTAIASYTVSLLASGTYSESVTDDTNTKTNYISINAAPAAPAGLSSATLSMSTASVGTNPYLAALATDQSGGNIVAANTLVTRYTSGTVNTNTVTDVYNAYTGTLAAYFNGSSDGSRAMTSGSDTGTYGNLVISVDRDAHAMSASTYPSDFYKVFSAYFTKSISAISVGYHDIKLTHTTTGNTNVTKFVKDDVTAVPTVDISSATLTEGTSGTYRYISGIPYYNTGSPTVSLTGAKIYDWIGQTFLGPVGSATPFTIEPDATTNGESTSGSVTSAASLTKLYSQLDGGTTYLSGGIPKANTGNTSVNSYTIGTQSITVAPASTSAVQKIKFKATNVNGTGATVTFNKFIQVFTNTPSGFVETSITAPSGATTAIRIAISGATGANPTFSNSTNYYTNNVWTGAVTIAGTDEAVVRWNQLKWFNTDLSTGYLPVGPNLNSGRTSGNQHFRGAFTRGSLQNFNVTFTGKISGLFFAAPGTAISTASTLNGWIDASLSYAGSGVPGAGTGGNGSNGCAITVADRVPTGTVVSGTTYRFTLGSENLANAFGNQLLFCIVLASGDYVTSWSFS
jgi:hypothetical protein